MRDKLVRLIKSIINKTLVPLKHKLDETLRKFYLSIAFRIAFYYVRLFICYGVLFFIVVYVIYIRIEISKYNDYADQIMSSLESKSISFDIPHYEDEVIIYYYKQDGNRYNLTEETDQDVIDEYRKQVYEKSINPYQDQGVSIQIKKKDTLEVIYSDVRDSVEGDKQFFNLFSYNYKDNGKFFIKKFREFTVNDESYQVYFQYDITQALTNLHKFLLFLILVYFIFVIFVAKYGQRGIERLLQPIKNMSAIANRLTVNNLHSERLNVDGTKNELKDLASTMNSMLDRIDISYESQKQFVSDASHELRTPIAVIQGYANMLRRWGMEDREVLAESIDAIANEADSMKDLVEKLLFLSRHDKKALKLERKLFNMKNVVEEMVRETKMVVNNRVISAPVLEDVTVYGDKQALKQAVRIFIDNAVKYSEDGDSITISCMNRKGTCIVTVEDTGIGMKKEDMDKIFDRFYRADNARNGGVEGHGLGLSIAKLIVLGHTGIIKVRSQYKKGSSFKIILPDYYRQGFVK